MKKEVEYVKYGFNFQNMLQKVRRYRSEAFFPQGINFKEPDGKPDYKEEI